MRRVSRKRRQILDALIVIVPAVLLGPPIGGLVLAAGSIIYILFNLMLGTGGLEQAQGGETLSSLILLPPLYAVFSYAMAGIPAAMAAVGIALQSWWTGRISFLQVACWITLSIVTYAAVLFSGDEWQPGGKEIGFGIVFLVCGLIAGWFLFKWFTPLLSHQRGGKGRPEAGGKT